MPQCDKYYSGEQRQSVRIGAALLNSSQTSCASPYRLHSVVPHVRRLDPKQAQISDLACASEHVNNRLYLHELLACDGSLIVNGKGLRRACVEDSSFELAGSDGDLVLLPPLPKSAHSMSISPASQQTREGRRDALLAGLMREKVLEVSLLLARRCGRGPRCVHYPCCMFVRPDVPIRRISGRGYEP